jgi:hypothetical protein
MIDEGVGVLHLSHKSRSLPGIITNGRTKDKFAVPLSALYVRLVGVPKV